MTTYYFADNASGAHANAIQGNDAWDGLSPTFTSGTNGPRRNPVTDNFNYDTLQAGDQVLFAIGGKWITTGHVIGIERNSNATADNPIVIDQYDPGGGVTGKPWIQSSHAVSVIELGGNADSGAPWGGVTIRNLKLQGSNPQEGGADQSVVLVRAPVRNFTIQDCEIYEGWQGLRSECWTGNTNTFFTARGNEIHDNNFTGWLGSATDCLIEDNYIHHNGTGGGSAEGDLALHHGIYYGSASIENKRLTIRANRLIDNNLFGGHGAGGNLTFRGKLDGTTVEGNLIVNTTGAYNSTCYGISHFPGYGGYTEYHLNTIIRGNTTVNTTVGIIWGSCPDIIVEDNVHIDLTTSGVAGKFIEWPAGELSGSPVDTVPDSGATVRNNTAYFSNPRAGTTVIKTNSWGSGGSLNNPGAGVVLANNAGHFGSAPGSCYVFSLTEASPTVYSAIVGNLRSGGDGFHNGHVSLSAFEAYYDALSGTDCSGNVDGSLLTAAVPSDGNGWSVQIQSGSAARNAGHTTHYSPLSINGYIRDASPDIGANEYESNP